MTKNDHPNKLELSIRPHSGVDSAQWDWGISIKKTKTMLITTYQKLHKLLDKEINMSVNNHTVTSEKLLGVVVDQNLIWKGHVDKVHRSVSMRLAKF